MKLGTYGKEKIAFTRSLMLLEEFMRESGYSFYRGDGTCRDGHRDNSYHYRGLAQDYNLFDKDGKYLTKTEDHKPCGGFWKMINPKCTWGGDFKNPDGNHYSWGEGKLNA